MTTKFRTAKNQSHLVLRFPLSSLARDPKSYHRWAKVLIGLPGAKRVGYDIEITLRQATLAIMYENILMRDGNVELKSDWDVGNKQISNANDFTIRNSDGSQTSVAKGLVTIYHVKQWERFKKPSCPKGLKPKAQLSIGAINVKYPFTLTGSITAYIAREDRTTWQANINAYVLNQETKKYRVLSDGEIIAMVQCQ